MVGRGPLDNLIDGQWRQAQDGDTFEKHSPTTGDVLWRVARSRAADVSDAVAAATLAFDSWRRMPGVRRGMLLNDVCDALAARAGEIVDVVCRETGKNPSSARGEMDAAIQLGRFFAGEGQRLYGRTTTSQTPGKWAMTVREPLGVAGLIPAANTPIANVAWKVMPALICGNTVVLKSAEDTPATAAVFADIATRAGLPPGVLNVVHGLGVEAGEPLVVDHRVPVISFTGSSGVGRHVAELCARRLARVSLELGGKNPLVVLDDADLELAVSWAVRSAFSNAGQRCASGSRLFVTPGIYPRFRSAFLEATAGLTVGSSDQDALGPVISEAHLHRLIAAVAEAAAGGVPVLIGGHRLTGEAHRRGYYFAPTVLESPDAGAPVSLIELFGPVVNLHRVADLDTAIAMANASPYGLTAGIHTRSLDSALRFVRDVHAGAVMVNAGTFGSEPHMPFGGVKASGNGTREPGTEALDVYSNTKDVYIQTRIEDC